MTDGEDELTLPFELVLRYEYAAGQHATRFLTALRDEGRLYGTRRSGSGTVLFPPRPVDGITGERTDEWVEVGPEGTVTGCTIVEIPFTDPMTGRQRPVPYGFAFIRLDGADTNIYHFLETDDLDAMEVGMRVEAVLRPRDERTGSLRDIVHFRRID